MFNHENFSFEIWLLGQNKQTQKHYWELLQQSDWKAYPISTNPHEAIIQHCIVANPNFEHLEELTQQIEKEALAFIQEIAKIFA
ncbi:MAG: hypothetical protein COA50_07965 [Flavobacteriaceae bacterium]|nr:MAG: hypothetical protein COA50_07965 [Flavobacteriaceae bacterium]